MKYKNILFASFLIVAVFALGPHSALAAQAQEGLVQCGGPDEIPCTFCDFFVLLYDVIDFVLLVLGPAVVTLMVMIGGFNILAAAGNPQKVEKGKKMIQWALLGYGLMLISYLIVNTFFTVLDFNVEWQGLKNWFEVSC